MSRMLVEVCRAGRRESTHAGWVVAVDAAGRKLAAAGRPAWPVFARSALKPFQALQLLLGGAAARYELTAAELAVICSSHSGQERHVALVRNLLRRAGLAAEELDCGAHYPLHDPSADALRARTQPPSALHNNCSGKHAGMLLLCRHHGWPTTGYLAPAHPAQAAIREALARCSDLEPARLIAAVDGCSAPTYALPLERLAMAYARLGAGSAPGLPPAYRRALQTLAAAMAAHPDLVAGTGRLDTALMAAAPGLVAKGGAEGVYAVAVPARGLGVALKVADGQQRAVAPAAIEALYQLEVLDEAALRRLAAFHRPLLRNHAGREVGHLRPAFRLVTFPASS